MTFNLKFGYNGSSKNAVWPLKSSLDHSTNNYNGSSKADNPVWVGDRGTPAESARMIYDLRLHYQVHLHAHTPMILKKYHSVIQLKYLLVVSIDEYAACISYYMAKSAICQILAQ